MNQKMLCVIRRVFRQRLRKLSGARIIERIASMEIPPNDAPPDKIQDCCYQMRGMAEDWIAGK